jgi:chromosome segregation ATPase
MYDLKSGIRCVLGTLAVLGLLSLPGVAAAQSKIVCWKDKSGKVIGCGDKVPPEFQSSATKELDSRGVTRRTTESAEDTNLRRQREQDTARSKAEEDRKTVDQKRQDTALVETYSNEREIDLKRDRDLQVLDGHLEQLTSALKTATQRYNETRSRAETVEKNNKPVSPQLKTEIDRATSDKQRIEHAIEAKQKEKEDTKVRFAGYKKRYNELRGTVSQPVAPAPAQSPVAAKK